jgi:hypothetical protein
MTAGCEICGHEMDKAGCIGKIEVLTIIANEEFIEIFDRLPFGGYGEDTDMPCGDCAVKEGQLHHWGCDNEKCPKCGGQALGCACANDTGERYAIIK